jgi:formate/nitrite transporter FocA (FNT family)
MATDDEQLEGDSGSGRQRRSSRGILLQEIIAGLAELKRPASGLLLSSIAAGLEIGFSVLLMAVMITVAADHFSEPVRHLLVANMYSVGFILVIIGRSELFTEHTALAVLPVLDGQSSVGDLGKLWGIVLFGNLVGGAVFAGIATGVILPLGAASREAFIDLADRMLDHPWWVIFFSAVLAGWLMGEVGWVVAAARDTISQIVAVWLITTAIGFAYLHHVVVGSVEVLTGVILSEELTLLDFARFLLWAALGNAIGGVVFVALIKYGHASRSGQESEAREQVSENPPPDSDDQ